MEPRPPIWLVTGASGFLGRRFATAVAARQDPPKLRLLVHRNPVTRPAANTDIVSGSLGDDSDLQIGVTNVDAVIHFAGVTHACREEDYQRVNGLGTQRLAQAAAAAGVKRFIHISSRAIGPECGAYARSKLHAEQAVKASGVPFTILRLAEVYGPGSREGLNALVRLVRTSPLVPYPIGPFILAPLFVDDVVNVLCKILAAPTFADRTYNVAGPTSYGLRELIRIIANTFALSRLTIPIPAALFDTVVRVSNLIGRPIATMDQLSRLRCPKDALIGHIERDFGFAPIPFEEALKLST